MYTGFFEKMSEQYRSRVYTDRPDYADFNAPEKFQAKRSAMEKLASLEKELKQAIETEAYEEAAKLRDQIRALRGQ